MTPPHLRLVWSERIHRQQYEAEHEPVCAATSWRGYAATDWWNAADIVIGGDSGQARRRSFEVYVLGDIKQIVEGLAMAQQWVRDHYSGNIEFTRMVLPKVTVNHPLGPTTEFTDPKVVYVADLPK